MRLTAAAAAAVWLADAAAVTVGPVHALAQPPPVPTVAFAGDSIGRDAEPEITAAVEATNPITWLHTATGPTPAP